MYTNKTSGFVLIWIVGITSVASIFLMICMESLIGFMSLSNCKNVLNSENTIRSIARTVLTEDYSFALTNHMTFDQNRLLRRLQWAFPSDAQLINIERFPFSTEPFTEKAQFNAYPNPTHPLGDRVGHSIQQKISLEYLNKTINKVKKIELTAHLKEIPSSELSFISPSVFSPDNLSIPIRVNNGATLCHGFRNSTKAQKFQCDTLITKFYETQILQKPYKYLYKGYQYAFSYGIDPFKLLIPDGNTQTYKNQSYLEKKGSTVVLFDGEVLSHQIPGISVRSFNENVKRVVIDLGQISRSKGILYIHAETEKAANQGLVIKGSSANTHQQPHAILSNSSIWLWGNHTGSPIVIGTTTGHWTLTDSLWIEGKGCNNPLNLNWRGYLFSPYNLTIFTSPQSGNEQGSFKIEGTLLAGGSISGNLKELLIDKPIVNNPISKFSEKLLILENIE